MKGSSSSRARGKSLVLSDGTAPARAVYEVRYYVARLWQPPGLSVAIAV